MQYLDQEGKAVYTSKNGRTSKSLPALECLANRCSHIPNRGEQIEISRDIKIIHELIESDSKLSSGYFCSDEYKKSYALLENSEKICFLGFGFHEVNMRRFNFFQPEKTKEREIFATFANLGDRQIKILLSRLSKYGLSNIKYSGHVCNNFFNFESSLD